MPSQEDYDSDYDAIPEAGRTKPHLDTDESDNEDLSSGLTRRPRFSNDDADDDDDPPTAAEESAPPPSTAVKPIIRQPTAFLAPDSDTSSGGPTFHNNNNNNNNNNKTPIHAALSVEGTSMFCVEGYVNTPELSAGRGGGLSQGLPANGPYKSLFRARSESRTSNKPVPVAVADAGLHVLADAAHQSPDAAPSPTSTVSPAPVPAALTQKKRTGGSSGSRKPSPLVAASPALSVAPLDGGFFVIQPSPRSPSNHPSSPLVAGRSPPRRPSQQAKPRSATAKGKSKEKAPPPTVAPLDGNSHHPSDERHVFSSRRQQSGPPPSSVVESRGTESTMRQARPRNRSGTKETSCTPQSPAPVNDSSYDHVEEDCYSSYYEAVPSDASHTPVTQDVRDGGQSLSPPPPRAWEPSRPSSSSAAKNAYPVSTHTTSNESSPALVADSRPRRSSTPSTKPRMLTLLIEDRRNGTDELAEVRVRLKSAEGYFWADAIEVCSALQSGPSRIDGPAKLFTMRGKYRQTFLRISTDGEETSQSANLKVELDKTLSIIVESISDPRGVLPTPSLSSKSSPLVSTGRVVSALNTTHPLTPMSNVFDLEGIPPTPLNLQEPGQWTLGARKRKRVTSVNHIQSPLFDSSDGRNLTSPLDVSARTVSTPCEHDSRPRKSRRSNPSITPFDGGGYMPDSPPTTTLRVQRKDQIASGSRLHSSAGYETDQPLPSARTSGDETMVVAQEQRRGGSDRRIRSLLQPPPTPSESAAQRMRDNVISFLQHDFMQDASKWNEFTRDRAQIGSLSNVMLLRIYWFAEEQVDKWLGARTPPHLNHKEVEISDILAALGVTKDWYRECHETLSLVITYGEGNERGEDPRAVAACRDRAPKSRAGSSGPTDLVVLLRQVHEDHCKSRTLTS